MMCGGPDTANQVRDRKKRAETKVFANGEQIKKYLIIPSLRPAQRQIIEMSGFKVNTPRSFYFFGKKYEIGITNIENKGKKVFNILVLGFHSLLKNVRRTATLKALAYIFVQKSHNCVFLSLSLESFLQIKRLVSHNIKNLNPVAVASKKTTESNDNAFYR